MKSTSAAAGADLQESSQLKELLRFAAGRSLEPIVRRAYRIEDGTAHRWLRRIGEHYLGLKASRLPRFLVLLLFKISYAAMHSFARHSTSSLKSIGDHPIDFDDLRANVLQRTLTRLQSMCLASTTGSGTSKSCAGM